MNHPATRPKRSSAQTSIRQLLRREPKMPAVQSRRLNELIDRSKSGRISSRERKELSHLIENVDRQSFLMVANALMKYIALHGELPSKGDRSKPSRRRRTVK